MDTLLLLTSLIVFGGITDGDTMTSHATFVVHVTGTAREGQTLTLSCYLSGPPASSIALPSSYVWVKDGKVIPEKTEGTLTLSPLTSKDVGDYECGASELDIPRESHHLEVIYLQEISVTINRDVNEGDMAVITCSVDSHPTASLTWIVDGNEVGHVTGNVDYYVIPQVVCSDGKNYTCRATNPDLPDREETATTRLHVKCAKDGASVLPKPRIYQDEGIAYIGYPLMLHCYTSSPADDGLTYIWFKDAQKVKADSSPFYWFASVKKGDRGVYTCQTSLEKPRALSSTSDPLTVHPRDPPETMVKKEQQRYDRTKRSTRLPTPAIIHDSLPACGKRLSLQCLIMGKYDVRDHIVYTWYKDNKLYKENWAQILWFPNISEADKGNYTCTASKGPAETTSHPSFLFDITPVYSPHLRIKQATAEGVVKAKVGENVTLTCEVIKSNPMVPYTGYTWSYLPSPHALKQPLQGNRRIMILGPLTKESKGQYFCQARNDQNFATVTLIGNTSVTLEVIYLDSISLTSDLAVNESEPVTLTCRVNSYPVANITWIVNGESIRTVIDTVDHYFIRHAACSDGMNYTCFATNSNLPGQELTATTHLDVLCRQDTQNGCLQNDTIEADVSAPFNFTLPKQSQVVVTHPSGQDLMTVYHNCTFDISTSFQSRCLHTHCNPDQHFSFILTNVTATDAGNYTCKEKGSQGRLTTYCNKILIVMSRDVDDTKSDSSILFALSVTLNVLLISLSGTAIIRNRHETVDFLKRFWPSSRLGEANIQKRENRAQGFDGLYDKRGGVYIFPPLEQPSQTEQTNNDEGENESSPLMSANQQWQQKSAEYLIKDSVRHMLQNIPCKSNLPSFILHNTHLSRQENVILILSRKIGVALMIVRAEKDVNQLQRAREGLQHLLKARETVRKLLHELVKPESIGAVIILPNLPKDAYAKVEEKLRILKILPDVKLLLGQDKKDIMSWAKGRSCAPDSKVWKLSNADSAFKMVASEFLTSTSSFRPNEFTEVNSKDETWLLTPKQVEIRDSTAKLLHLWGPKDAGKSTLMMLKAKQWLADEKAVILAVGRENYTTLPSHFIKESLSIEGEKPRICVCHMTKALQMAVKELAVLYPSDRICIITNILDKAMFESILLAVQSHSVSDVWSVSAENLHKIDAQCAKQAKELGWKTIELPLQMKCPKSKVKVFNLLSPSSATAPSQHASEDSPGWRVVDHCLHPNYKSDSSCCLECKKELQDIFPPSPKQESQRSNVRGLHTGNPHVSPDIKRLDTILDDLGLFAVFNLSGLRRREGTIHIADGEENTSAHLLWVYENEKVKVESVLMVHWDKKDEHPQHQNYYNRSARLKEHKQQWRQVASESRGQVIFLLLTPSPARSLLNLPDPVVMMQPSQSSEAEVMSDNKEEHMEVSGFDQVQGGFARKERSLQVSTQECLTHGHMVKRKCCTS